MNIQVEHITKDEVSISVSVPWEAVRETYDKLLQRYAKFPIKGFRNAPPNIIASTFKKQIDAELASTCAGRLCRQALQKEQLTAGSPLSITAVEVNNGRSFGFKAGFLKMPEFELPDYFRLQLSATDPEEKTTEISEKLLSATAIELPEAFITNELQYTATTAPTDDERKMAADRMKLLLILKKIARQDIIEVPEELVEQRIAGIARENATTPEQVREYLQANGGWSRLLDFLLAEQVLDYIMNNQQL